MFHQHVLAILILMSKCWYLKSLADPTRHPKFLLPPGLHYFNRFTPNTSRWNMVSLADIHIGFPLGISISWCMSPLSVSDGIRAKLLISRMRYICVHEQDLFAY